MLSNIFKHIDWETFVQYNRGSAFYSLRSVTSTIHMDEEQLVEGCYIYIRWLAWKFTVSKATFLCVYNELRSKRVTPQWEKLYQWNSDLPLLSVLIWFSYTWSCTKVYCVCDNKASLYCDIARSTFDLQLITSLGVLEWWMVHTFL